VPFARATVNETGRFTSGRVPDDPARNPAATIRIKTVRTSGPPARRRHKRGTVNGVTDWDYPIGHISVIGIAVNPALTIMANALRVGDHVRERLA